MVQKYTGNPALHLLVMVEHLVPEEAVCCYNCVCCTENTTKILGKTISVGLILSTQGILSLNRKEPSSDEG